MYVIMYTIWILQKNLNHGRRHWKYWRNFRISKKSFSMQKHKYAEEKPFCSKDQNFLNTCARDQTSQRCVSLSSCGFIDKQKPSDCGGGINQGVQTTPLWSTGGPSTLPSYAIISTPASRSISWAMTMSSSQTEPGGVRSCACL